MRENPVKQALAAGKSQFGTLALDFAVPALPGLAAAAGADFVIYDQEHGGLGDAEVKAQVAGCRGLGVTPLVRPAQKTYETVARLLDFGCLGLLLQMVGSAEEAERIVTWTRYPPAGVRGAIFGSAHDDYLPGSFSEKMAVADSRTLIMPMIETKPGLERVAEIVAVEGVDVPFVGPFDPSLAVGTPGDFDSAPFGRAMDRILEACEAAGKPLGAFVSDAEWGRRLHRRGLRMIAYSFDSEIFRKALSDGLATVRG